jgi:hypothetical protein
VTAPIAEALALGAGVVVCVRTLVSATAQLVPELDEPIRSWLERQSHDVERAGVPLHAVVAVLTCANVPRPKARIVAIVGLSLVAIAVSSISTISRLPAVSDAFGGSLARMLWLWLGMALTAMGSVFGWPLPLHVIAKSTRITVWRGAVSLLLTLLLLHLGALLVAAAWQLPSALDTLNPADRGPALGSMLEGLLSIGEVWDGLARNRPLLLGWTIAASPLALPSLLSTWGVLIAASPRVSAVVTARAMRAVARQPDPVVATLGERSSWLAGVMFALADWLA